ncbi:BTB POZ domain-containing 6-like [Paramuricea clavata]|uniref:BTB POZ domain-containing 6-like n=1 Tax=Paramuricea clavata TaxID=317549 RepID=A0A7D9JNN4_PARCT|nr:BTB POZ domain-containing 6-like [Paramuricea clavata]
MATSQQELDWQSTKKTVLERSRHMFNNPFMSDIAFSCEGSDKKFFAHKYVLATSSAVFYAMFYGELAEKNSVVHLSDTDEESLEEFLRFLYTDECNLTTDNALFVLYLAKKYIVPSVTISIADVGAAVHNNTRTPSLLVLFFLCSLQTLGSLYNPLIYIFIKYNYNYNTAILLSHLPAKDHITTVIDPMLLQNLTSTHTPATTPKPVGEEQPGEKYPSAGKVPTLPRDFTQFYLTHLRPHSFPPPYAHTLSHTPEESNSTAATYDFYPLLGLAKLKGYDPFAQAIQFDENKLEEKCWDFIDLNTSEAVVSDGFCDINQATLVELVKREPLNVEEVDLFKAVLKWSEAECSRKGIEANAKNKRAAMGNAIYQIRFASMTLQDLAQNASQSGVLTPEEILLFFEKLGGVDRTSEVWNMSETRAKKKLDIFLTLFDQFDWKALEQSRS